MRSLEVDHCRDSSNLEDYNDNDELTDETERFLSSDESQRSYDGDGVQPQPQSRSTLPVRCRWRDILLGIASLMFVGIVISNHHRFSGTSKSGGLIPTTSSSPVKSDAPAEDPSSESDSLSSSLLFVCPSSNGSKENQKTQKMQQQQQRPAENVVSAAEEHEIWYDAVSRSILDTYHGNVSAYMQTFRETEYDNWGHSYSEVKHAMTPWKERFFFIQDENDKTDGDHSDENTGSDRDYSLPREGAVIYESACGIGMNFYMTLELMAAGEQEVDDKHPKISSKKKAKRQRRRRAITNVTVYGNDVVASSVTLARTVAKNFLPAQGRLGSICQADSTQLTFVPDNAFDLVFTGYISPLFDPLRLGKKNQDATDTTKLTTEAKFARYTADCERPERRSAVQAAQLKQNDWYAAWVGEMIRIAKPGAPVIVEQVSYPLCDALFDWGGVSPDFWPEAIKRYGWDVDPKSIAMDDDTLYRKRYHVFMRKNEKVTITNDDED